MLMVDQKESEAKLEEQLTVFMKDGKILIRTSEGFNDSGYSKQSQIVSTVVDILLKNSSTDTLLTFGISEDGNIALNTLDRFFMLSLSSQADLLLRLSQMMRKLSETKTLEKEINSEYVH